MFHIFRNSPLGRENLLQSIYFCEKVGNLPLSIYVPTSLQCLMYFDNSVVTVELDASYTRHPDTAVQHIDDLMSGSSVPYEIFEPARFTSGTLPEIPVSWSVMACPRAMSQCTSRIGIGHLGPKVRTILKHACFPVFLPCPCFKAWTNISAFFGGSDLGLRAVRQAVTIAHRSGVPLTIYTQVNGISTRECCERKIADAGLGEAVNRLDCRHVFFESGTFEENLYDVPWDSLVLVGAAGESLVRELVFGSKLEIIQKTLPNPILVVGPECTKAI